MYRTLIFFIGAIFWLSACSLLPVKKATPTAIIVATKTSAPATAAPATAAPPTNTPTVQPATQTSWLSQLEIIGPQNWSRLQLLKTFPAEMPMNHSAAAIAPDGKTMLVGSSTNAELLFFDLASGNLSKAAHVSGVANASKSFNTIKYLADGSIMANSDGPYAIYHIDSAGNVLSTWNSTSFALSADDKTMALGIDVGTALVDIATNKTQLTLDGDYAIGYSFSHDHSKIAISLVGVDYRDVDIWDIAGKTRLARLKETGDACFSPNGKFLASTSYDDNNGGYFIKIFSPDGSTQITTIKSSDPKGLGIDPVFSPDGAIIVSQIPKGPLAAWDTANWRPLQPPVIQGELASFSPDGRMLMTRMPDGAILLWGVLP